MKKIVLIILLLVLAFHRCCRSERDTNASYPENVSWDTVLMGYSNGLMLIRPECFVIKDERLCFTFCRYSSNLVEMTDSEMQRIGIGDVIKIDCLRQVTVSKKEINDNWKSSKELGVIYGQDFSITREPGRIDISDDYFFLHPIYYQYYDGHIEIDGITVPYEDINKWIMYSTSGLVCDTFEMKSPVVKYDDPIWIPVASDCVIDIIIPNAETKRIEADSLKETMTSFFYNEGIERCYINGKIDDNGEAYELEIEVYQSE